MKAEARVEIIELQRRWVADLKNRIYELGGREDAVRRRYYAEYRELFQHGYERLASRSEIVQKLANSQIACVGDFHTLRLAQSTFVKLLDQVATEYEKPLIIGLEMLHTKDQVHADAYLAGKSTEEEFLAAIDYQRTWGFAWANYRPIFELAREHHAKVIGLNVDLPDSRHRLRDRDRHAASLIAAASAMHPDHLVATLYGDLHVGESHLPYQIDVALEELYLERNQVILYQNSETFYWELVGQGRERVADAVRIKPNVYCIMAATPLVKFQSWLIWEEAGEELHLSGLDALDHDFRGPADLSEQFHEIIESIVEFLHIDVQGLDNFKLYTTGELDFLDQLRKQKLYTPSEIKAMKDVIAQRRSAFFPRARVVYLGRLSINDAAEMAAKFIRFACIQDEYEGEFSPKDACYVSIFDEAIGIFGTLLMNPRYRVMDAETHILQADSLKGRRLSEAEQLARDVSRLVARHEEMMERVLSGVSGRTSLRSLYTQTSERYRGFTRALGAILGSQLFRGVDAGALSVDVVKQLFFETWSPGEPFRKYVELRHLLMSLPNKVLREQSAL